MSKNQTIVTIVVTLCLTALLVVTGLTTHASHLRQIQENQKEMVACIESPRSAADCRVIVYGSY